MSKSIFNTDLEKDPYQFVLAQNLVSSRNDVSFNSVTRAEPFKLINFPDLDYYLKPGY